MAGGEGKRLRSVTGDSPKPMVPLLGRPVLEHILCLLRRSGIDDVCMSLRYKPEAIRGYFGSGEELGMRIRYHVEDTPLGTAGGVRACLDPQDRRSVLVISGDCVCDFDLRELIEAHRRHGAAVTMALHAEASPLRYGVVLTDPFGRVVSFTEKPGWERVVSDMINTGIYVVSPEAMALVPEGRAFDFSADLFPLLLRRGMEIRALPMDGYWSDIGTPRSYYTTCLDALDGRVRLFSCARPEAADESAAPPEPSRSPAAREVRFADRARIMRFVSQSLMEAGADFSDGLHLDTGEGRVSIAPARGKSCIIIDAAAPDGSPSPALAEKYERFVRKLGKTI